MVLANHKTLFDVSVDAAFSETSLHKVLIVQRLACGVLKLPTGHKSDQTSNVGRKP